MRLHERLRKIEARLRDHVAAAPCAACGGGCRIRVVRPGEAVGGPCARCGRAMLVVKTLRGVSMDDV